MLFSRLLKMKEMAIDLKDVLPRSEVVNPLALEMGLVKDSGKLTFSVQFEC